MMTQQTITNIKCPILQMPMRPSGNMRPMTAKSCPSHCVYSFEGARTCMLCKGIRAHACACACAPRASSFSGIMSLLGRSSGCSCPYNGTRDAHALHTYARAARRATHPYRYLLHTPAAYTPAAHTCCVVMAAGKHFAIPRLSPHPLDRATHAGCNVKVLKSELVDAKAMLKKLREMMAEEGYE